MTYPFETVAFSGDTIVAKSFNPSFATAQKVAYWYIDKNSASRVMIRNTLTGDTQEFVRDGREIVNKTCGEVIDECPGCAEKDMEKGELQRALKVERRRNAILAGDIEKKARASDEWDDCEEIFNFWRTVSGHVKSKFTFDRFQEVVPRLREHGKELCIMAVHGGCYDPFVDKTPRKNGTKKVFDDIELIMRDQKHFQESCNRAPRINGTWDKPEFLK